MKTSFVALAFAVASLAAPAVLACGGHQTAAAGTTVVAANTDKAAPAQKSDATASTTAPAAPAEAKKSDAKAEFKLVSVEQVQQGLDTLKKDKKPFVVMDANGKGTRDKMGVIPTAVLLPSASEYDLALLPSDKATPVVFYCANERCTASHTAAKRAMGAGHSDVAVLGAGIKGWVDAGKAVDKPVG